MLREHSIETDRALLVFDPHQDAEWLRAILDKEAGSFSHLVLGGDYFDPKTERAGPAGGMAALLREIERTCGDHLTLLWGNHDIPYLEIRSTLRAERELVSLRYGIPGDTSGERARVLFEEMGESFWTRGRLFRRINDVLISHAGVARRFWPWDRACGKALDALEATCAEAVESLGSGGHPILEAGACRGGLASAGGITWQDFEVEFDDEATPLPQIVGHTPGRDRAPLARARRNGRSWCLDGLQSIYGILDRSGDLEVRVP